MTRSQSLALGRLDGAEPIVILRLSDVAVILEALRYSGEADTESGGTGATQRRIIARIATLAHIDPARFRVDLPDTRDWTLIVEESA